MARYQYEPFPYVTPPELAGDGATGAPVIIVGAGPIGLAAAIDLATHGVASIVVDDNNVVSVGSRAICWAKRSLEIFDRLGIGERMLAKGVTWKLGRVYRGDEEDVEYSMEDYRDMDDFDLLECLIQDYQILDNTLYIMV